MSLKIWLLALTLFLFLGVVSGIDFQLHLSDTSNDNAVSTTSFVNPNPTSSNSDADFTKTFSEGAGIIADFVTSPNLPMCIAGVEIGKPLAASTDYADYRSTDYADYRSTDYADYRSTNYADYRSTNYADYRSTDYADYRSTDYADYNNRDYTVYNDDGRYTVYHADGTNTGNLSFSSLNSALEKTCPCSST